MLRSIQKLIGDKRKQLIFPIFLMSLDAIGSLVMYLMLYFTVIHLLNGSLTGGLVRNYTIVCLISIILRLIIYRTMTKLGLQGKAIMPFLVSFGCNIGGITGTRVIDSWGQRVMTIALSWVP